MVNNYDYIFQMNIVLCNESSYFIKWDSIFGQYSANTTVDMEAKNHFMEVNKFDILWHSNCFVKLKNEMFC